MWSKNQNTLEKNWDIFSPSAPHCNSFFHTRVTSSFTLFFYSTISKILLTLFKYMRLKSLTWFNNVNDCYKNRKIMLDVNASDGAAAAKANCKEWGWQFSITYHKVVLNFSCYFLYFSFLIKRKRNDDDDDAGKVKQSWEFLQQIRKMPF